MKPIVAVLLLLSSVATYFSSDGKLLFYAIFLLLFSLFTVMRGLEKVRINLMLIPIGYFLVTVCSLLSNYDNITDDAFQSLLYPFVYLFVLLGGRNVLYDLTSQGAKLVILFFCINGLVAFASVMGLLSSLPIFGDITRGRYIFGTSIQSSAGLIWNVNYYAITQLVGFWVSIIVFLNYRLSKFWLMLIFLIACSTIMGSSRGVTSALILSLLIYGYFHVGFSVKRLMEILGGIFVFSLGALFAYVSSNEQLSTSLRLDRGTNGRDELWQYAFELFSDAPLLGLFSIEKIKTLLVVDGGLQNTTVQNTFLFTLVRLGILGVLFLTLFVLAAVSNFIKNKQKSSVDIAIFCCFFCLVLDSMVRSYSLGGVGFAPFMMTICGCCLMVMRKQVLKA